MTQMAKNLPTMQKLQMQAGFDPWFGKIPWRMERLPTLVIPDQGYWRGMGMNLASQWD